MDASEFDEWETGFRELLVTSREVHAEERAQEQTFTHQAKQEARNAQRHVEMAMAKQRAADRRKELLGATGGMKYTAIAMANRKN